MESESQINGTELRVEGVNQRNTIFEKDMQFRHVENIIPRHGKRVRIEGKRVHTVFAGSAVINIVGFGDKFIIQTNNGVHLIDI